MKIEKVHEDERYALDGTKMTYDLRWKPKTSFDNGIKETIEWYRQNEWFWKGIYAP